MISGTYAYPSYIITGPPLDPCEIVHTQQKGRKEPSFRLRAV